jgi:hypothetical protein
MQKRLVDTSGWTKPEDLIYSVPNAVLALHTAFLKCHATGEVGHLAPCVSMERSEGTFWSSFNAFVGHRTGSLST